MGAWASGLVLQQGADFLNAIFQLLALRDQELGEGDAAAGRLRACLKEGVCLGCREWVV